jgi:tetraacyldisaccharide 4'-kinase
VAVLDDGLQVVELARDLEIAVVDVRFPGGDGMIPVGTRRLPLTALLRADVVWLNHAVADTPVPPRLRPYVRDDALIVRGSYRPVGWLERGALRPLGDLPPGPVVAFAGVARPAGFFRQLRDLGLQLDRTWIFPDHHRYAWSEIEAIHEYHDTHVIVTTEKDAARLPVGASVWALRIETHLHSGEAELRARLATLVGEA